MRLPRPDKSGLAMTPPPVVARSSPSCLCEKRSDEAISAGGEGGDEYRLSNDKKSEGLVITDCLTV